MEEFLNITINFLFIPKDVWKRGTNSSYTLTYSTRIPDKQEDIPDIHTLDSPLLLSNNMYLGTHSQSPLNRCIAELSSSKASHLGYPRSSTVGGSYTLFLGKVVKPSNIQDRFGFFQATTLEGPPLNISKETSYLIYIVFINFVYSWMEER